MIRLVNAFARAANTTLEWLFPTAPDELMAVADAAGVTINSPDVKAAEQKAKARAAAAKRAQSPAMQRTPAPWFQEPSEPVHPALRSALSDDNLERVVGEWSR